MSRSEQIKERLFECIHNGELDNKDLISLVEYVANDILQAKTKANYHKGKISKITGREKCYAAWRWAKEKFQINGEVFIVDNE